VVGEPFNSADPLIGRKLDGRYEVLERLGSGGAGVVYRGRQTHLGRFVAIKVLHQETASSTEWRRRFQREAIALSVLAHPNVVPVTDFGVDNGVPFLVMELLEGQTLGALIKEGPLPLWRALEIARQTLRVLAFSHIKGVVHGDLKPTNVFLQALPDQADHVRLLDFGMAKFVEGSSARAPAEPTSARIMIGTPAYMAPEQVAGAPTDEATEAANADAADLQDGFAQRFALESRVVGEAAFLEQRRVERRARVRAGRRRTGVRAFDSRRMAERQQRAGGQVHQERCGFHEGGARLAAQGQGRDARTPAGGGALGHQGHRAREGPPAAGGSGRADERRRNPRRQNDLHARPAHPAIVLAL